ncbi:MAG TPA: DUF1549 domain-containing protein [Planctomycetaceae bacterium]|nr:DUF1549 domain-containing protein [Planctomycetaceae bacterium]
MTVKLTEVATERFVDNITSITPGALKGGVQAVARHPERNEVVVGGSDGVAKVYRMERLTNRVIGDDANLIRIMPAIGGRIFDVTVSQDGKRLAACSSLNGAGEVQVYSYEFDTSLPNDIKAIQEKLPTSWNAEERKKMEEYNSNGVKLISRTPIAEAGLYALAFHPDGKTLAASGTDGIIRLIDPETGEIKQNVAPVPISNEPKTMKEMGIAQTPAPEPSQLEGESIPEGAELVSLEVTPPAIDLKSRFEYVQLVVAGILKTGERIDVTRLVESSLDRAVAEIGISGVVRPLEDGQATLRLTLAGKSAEVPVVVSQLDQATRQSFVRDVNPVLSRLGCNQGTCHGSANGKAGFKLSLRGYDSIFDVRAFTDDHGARRTNVASPDDSLMLLKGTGTVPHTGGQLMQPGEPYYEIIRDWIAQGGILDLTVPRVKSIEVFPKNPIIQKLGDRQQVRVIAHYSDGSERDVTQEAFLSSGNTEIATVDRFGIMTALRRGEAPVLCRFEGAYAATTLTAMGNREEFVWNEPEKWNKIDELTSDKWQRMKIQPSGLCTDAEFIRRVYLDLNGISPPVEEVKKFLADQRESKVKRAELIDRLIGSKDYVEFWTNKWADLLQVNGKFLGREGATAFRAWIRERVEQNKPYDQFAREVITASGSNRENPAASYYKVLRDPDLIMENTTHLFMGVRFNCNKCHDHPCERWTQDQYYETAAFFAQTALKADPESKDRKIGGTAVEGAKAFYEIVYDNAEGQIKHERTGEVTAPEFPFEAEHTSAADESRREMFADWLTSTDNQYFARSYVNRIWGYLFGVGIIEPIDDIRAGNPPSNPALLDYLTQEFIDSGFNIRHIEKLICNSRTYQLSIEANRWNADDKTNYSHAIARRLPAEVLYDAIHTSLGAQTKIPGVPPGTRAAELPDVEIEIPGGFLNTFGRPPRESACECERTNEVQLGPVMALISGPTIAEAILDGNNDLAKLVGSVEDNQKLVDEIFLRILNRHASEEEVSATLKVMQELDSDHQSLTASLKERDTWWVTEKEKLEQQRLAAIDKAQAAVDARTTEIAPMVEAEEKVRAEKIAAAEAELKTYEATLPEKQAKWEQEVGSGVVWHVLKPYEAKSSNKAKLDIRDDSSVFVTGDNGKVTYTVRYKTDLKGITGIRLEALSDPELPGNGPGRNTGGNFVLTEFTLNSSIADKPDELTKIDLQNALADFNQDNYNITTSIDGKQPAQNNGWAVAGQTGSSHWATFETKTDVTLEGETILTFVMDQKYADNTHSLGKFRISVTTHARPIGLGIASPYDAILAVAPEERNDEQKKQISEFFNKQDAELQKKIAALNEAKKPLPRDARLVALEADLNEVSQPVSEDPKLAQLKLDLQQSEQQLGNKRLTTAQDLAWALINSPAFLFNH